MTNLGAPSGIIGEHTSGSGNIFSQGIIQLYTAIYLEVLQGNFPETRQEFGNSILHLTNDLVTLTLLLFESRLNQDKMTRSRFIDSLELLIHKFDANAYSTSQHAAGYI